MSLEPRPLDDFVSAFQIEGEPVRGRIARLGDGIDEILSAHDYPAPVARLLGEACALAALVGSSLKFRGRLIVQAQGDGPVSFVVADYDTTGTLRGYCRHDAEAVAALMQATPRPGADALLGKGVFIMTLDQGPDMERHQGVTAIEGDTLASSAEQYFAQSEQVPTRVRLAVGEVEDDQRRRWRAGGAMIQMIAADDSRGDTREVWERAEALFATLGDDELIDPQLSADRLLYRLFHEDGVRLHEPLKLKALCRCSPERVEGMLRTFAPDDLSGMIEDDGLIHVTCEYCARRYEIAPVTVGAGETGGETGGEKGGDA